jgi:hypothetical protein
MSDPRLQALLYYQNQTANFTYYLNLQPLSFMAAESFCMDRGAHLVSYRMPGEQQEVEQVGEWCIQLPVEAALLQGLMAESGGHLLPLQYYIGKGLLLSSYHKNYWMGLTADVWPFFYWTDNVTPSEPPAARLHHHV